MTRKDGDMNDRRPLAHPVMSRDEHAKARKAGVEARNARKLARVRYESCRYWMPDKGLCTNTAVPGQPIQLCASHGAGMVRAQLAHVRGLALALLDSEEYGTLRQLITGIGE